MAGICVVEKWPSWPSDQVHRPCCVLQAKGGGSNYLVLAGGD